MVRFVPGVATTRSAWLIPLFSCALTHSLCTGNDRDKSTTRLRQACIVLTTYSTIETDFRRQQYGFKRKGELEKEPSPLHQVAWHRIVLDEGQRRFAQSCIMLGRLSPTVRLACVLFSCV